MAAGSSTRKQCSYGSAAAPYILLLGVLLGVSQLQQAAAALPFEQYPIDWTRVPDNPEAAANLSTSCICALLNGTCTPGCCCDAACPTDLVEQFKAAGTCMPEGPPPQQLPYCVAAEPFAQVNLPAGDYYRLQQRAADSDFISQVLCVTADHNPSLGRSYPDPPAGDVGSNAQEAACLITPAAPAALSGPGGGYAYGQALRVLAAIPPAAAGLRVWGTLVLPAAALSAECLGMTQVGFMTRVPASLKAASSTCQRSFTTAAALAAVCGEATSPLSPTYWGSMQFPATPGATQAPAVVVKRLAQRDLATGLVVELHPAADLKPPAAGTGACSGVVVEAHFLMRAATDASTGALQVSAAQLSLVVADVAMPAAGPLVVDTAFSVNWANASVPDAVLQPLSGAPGYLPGFPLLAGVEASAPAAADPSSTRKAVSRLAHGLQLPGPGPAGRCSPSSVYAPTIGWGANMSASCTIGMTLSQLRTMCTANQPGKMLTDIMGTDWLGNLTTDQVLLGMWGNSDPNNINHWLPLKAAADWPPSTDLQWDEASSTCRNLATGLRLRLLTGVAYAEGNLQSKLLYASACFSYGSWTFDRLNGPALQLFELRFGADFVPKAGQQPIMSVRPAPPLIAPLPPDLFYPFLTSAAGRSRVGVLPSQWLLLSAMLWFTWAVTAML